MVGPLTPPPQRLGPNGVVVTPVASTAPSSAVLPPTQTQGAVDVNTNPPVRTLDQTQAPVSRPLGPGVQRAPDGSLLIEITGVGDDARDEQITTPDDIAPVTAATAIRNLGENQSAAETARLLATAPTAGSAGVAGVPFSGGTPVVPTLPGAGASTSDDAGITDFGDIVVTGRREADLAADATTAAPEENITPRPNILDRFANYTYQASVYLLSSEQYQLYEETGRKNVQGYNLLFQSGGADNNRLGPQQAAAGSFQEDGRNPFFPVDYYINDITLENRLFGKATQAAHSAATLKFTVIEPANISLIDRIYEAVQNIAPRDATGAVNYAAAVYLMVIRFYGYDQNGNIVTVSNSIEPSRTSDPAAVVEKFIPFRIRYINWSVNSQLVTYEFDCAPIGHQIGFTTRRGTIPKDIELSGATVGSMLSGEVRYGTAQAPANSPGSATTASGTGRPQTEPGESPTTAPDRLSSAPPKASAAPNNKSTIKQGLIAAMNLEQQRLVSDGIYEVADIYEIEFANGAEIIRDATVTKPGSKVNKNATPMANGQRDPSTRSPDKNSVDNTSRNFGITAGMQLVQAIDLIIRNSNYVTDQASIVINEFTGQPEPNPRAKPWDGVKWFNILVQATPLEYDNARNDFAYRVKFVIVPYETVDFNSAYFPQGKFRGLHKRYPWWFTGNNISVLDYRATFNKLYNLTVSGSSPDTSFLKEQRRAQTSSMRDIPFYQYQSRSTESDQGADGKANEVAANAAEYLYNSSDNANATIRIIGDPAWIQQASLAGGVDARNINYKGFAPDGTINFDTQDVLFEVVWQRPEDYDQETGVADPYGRTKKTFGDREPIQSVVYRARRVTSEFRSGRFETVIEGTLYNYPVPPNGTNKATGTTAAVNDTAATIGETARLTPEQASAATRNSVTPSASLGSGLSAAGFNINNLGVPGASSLVESARLQTYGGTGLKIPEPAGILNVGTVSGQFSQPAVAPFDTLQNSLPAAPATTNGLSVGPTADDIAEARRIQQDSGTPDAISADQVASNRRLNESLTGLLPIPRLPNPSVETSRITSQRISRDT